MCKAAIATGADGLMGEVHSNPEEALSDGFQALVPEQYQKVIKAMSLPRTGREDAVVVPSP